jgi:hypothetical protein
MRGRNGGKAMLAEIIGSVIANLISHQIVNLKKSPKPTKSIEKVISNDKKREVIDLGGCTLTITK